LIYRISQDSAKEAFNPLFSAGFRPGRRK